MNRILSTITILFISLAAFSQQEHDHWESVVLATDEWKYFPGVSDQGSGWIDPDFDDASWFSGPGGVGYGDNDDGTVINPVISVFLRKKFSITDISEIGSVVMHVDYDDGFIAYLNGVEIARRHMGNSAIVPYNQSSSALHEAVLPIGGTPESFLFTEGMKVLLVNGVNTLAIQVHNENIGSSDLSSSVFLSVGMLTSESRYSPVPSWFDSNVELTSSDLPIISIQTQGQEIFDEPRIIADLGIIHNTDGARNNITDAFTYSGKISIELRGESSQGFPKKSFTIETQDAQGNNLNVPLLGLPAENDWVLYAPFTDKTMMRDVLAFKMGRDLGGYAPRTRYAELILNGVYQGVYVLMEKIKVDKNRVDIASLKPEETSGDDLTGGYILRVDKVDGNDYPAWVSVPSPRLPSESNITFQYSDPDGEDLVSAQRTYIRDFIFDFESALSSSTYGTSQGYRKYIDVPSFIDFMIVTEIGKNIDGYVFSTYMHKDKDSNGGLLKMGPLWDFNLAFGNVDYLPNSQFAPGWTYNDQYRMYWFRRLMSENSFRDKFKCRWKDLRSSIFTDEYFSSTIDSIANVLNEAQERNYRKWNILGIYVWPNQFVGQTYEQEIGFLKNWIQARLDWMDKNTAVSDCSEVVTGAEEDLQRNISVWPNPAESVVTISSPDPASTEAKILIYSSTGKLLVREYFDGNFTWDTRGDNSRQVAPGVYVIRIEDPRHTYRVQKVILK